MKLYFIKDQLSVGTVHYPPPMMDIMQLFNQKFIADLENTTLVVYENF